jgi:hypothetical protein
MANGCSINRRARQGQTAAQPNWQQMGMHAASFGTDPMSKLADAINRLCDLMEKHS